MQFCFDDVRISFDSRLANWGPRHKHARANMLDYLRLIKCDNGHQWPKYSFDTYDYNENVIRVRWNSYCHGHVYLMLLTSQWSTHHEDRWDFPIRKWLICCRENPHVNLFYIWLSKFRKASSLQQVCHVWTHYIILIAYCLWNSISLKPPSSGIFL